MIPSIRTSPASSSAAAPTQATQQPAQAPQTAGATQARARPLDGPPSRPPANAAAGDLAPRRGHPLAALGMIGVSVGAGAFLAVNAMKRMDKPGWVPELLAAPAVAFGGLYAAYRVARPPQEQPAAASAAPARVSNLTLAEAMVAAEDLDGLNSGDLWHIGNHIRDYGNGNPVSPAVTAAIEQALNAEGAAPDGDIEAQRPAPTTAQRIAENLHKLVTANPPILPRESVPVAPLQTR